MALADTLIRGEAIAGLAPLTLDGSGQINAVGSFVNLTMVKDYGPEYAQPDASASNSFIEFAVANGIKAQWNQETKVLDGTTGSVKASGASGNADKIKFSAGGVAKADRETIRGLLGLPVLGWIPTGIKGADGSIEGYQYLIGTVTNFAEDQRQAETVATVAIEITGKSYAATTAGDTALATGPGSVTPLGKAAVSPTVLVSGDLTNLKAGKIVTK